MEYKQLTTNFNEYEFACPCCGDVKIDSVLVRRLQILRDLLGVPVDVNSGYRCKSHNKSIGGTSKSYHLLGLAADIRSHVGLNTLLDYILVLGLFNGIGVYPDEKFIHVDIRRDVSRWGSLGGKIVSFNEACKKI